MASLDLSFGNETLRLTAYADNVIRVRISRDFSPSLFDRYNIYRPEDVNSGEILSCGIQAGSLSACLSGDTLQLSTPKWSRSFRLSDPDICKTQSFFHDKLNHFHPESFHIIGDLEERTVEHADFEKSPKAVYLQTQGEFFYGLGESNEDRLIVNGKTYLERVIYQKCEIPVPFLMSKEGLGILCNATIWHGIDVCSRNEKEICWYLPDGDIDFFFFAGDTLPVILERFTYITGRPMLLPKWAYGLTFIDQYNADQFEVMRNAAKFRELEYPCDTISLEPGWMSKEYDFSTKKKWNIDRFFICDWARGKQPADFFFSAALKRYGYKLQLWLCCEHDFTAHAENLAGNPKDFGIEPWFDHLRQFVGDGAASFKVDPCHVVDNTDETRVYANGKAEPEMHNLMQTLCAKEMYDGAAETTGMRPMHHFCGGYTGTGAFTAATTGDSGGELKTLAWILNCGLSGISNITCDMNIHTKNTIHYCFFTAWCQLNSWAGFDHPWWAGDEMEAFFAFYDRLRYRLMPYIYSAAIEANLYGMPIVRAMPLMYDDAEVSNTVTQFMFGEQFLVSAFSDSIFLPGGSIWIDYWTGETYEGGQELALQIPENRGGALFVRGGAIIPTQPPRMFTSCEDEPKLILEIYPYGESSYTLFEDDGLSLEYQDGKRTETQIICQADRHGCTITVGSRKGAFNGMCSDRSYQIRLFTKVKPHEVKVNGSAADFQMDGPFLLVECGASDVIDIH